MAQNAHIHTSQQVELSCPPTQNAHSTHASQNVSQSTSQSGAPSTPQSATQNIPQSATQNIPQNASHGTLYICPTPLGNLGDITLRVKDALAACVCVYAEDTRVTGKLLRALTIQKPLQRLDEATLEKGAQALLNRVSAGDTICYCSDAGMPGVSDPGLRLVAMAREQGVCVEVLPGASACTLAYVASGFTHQQFFFGGFFPRKKGSQTALLSQLKALNAALIFYEAPTRVQATLETIAQELPTRRIALCRELTKLYEEVVVDTAQALLQQLQFPLKGEIVLVIEGSLQEEKESAYANNVEDARKHARTLLEQGISKKDVRLQIMHAYNISRNDAYAIVESESAREKFV